MALFTTQALSLQGLRGHVVDVEADVANGLPAFALVGLPDASLSEARDRVRAAVTNCGFSWPTRKVTVNLTPASLPKQGSGFDLSIAAAVLGCQGDFPAQGLANTVLFGELGLDGRVRASRGVLPAVHAAWQAGVSRVVVPWANRGEAELVSQQLAQADTGLAVVPVASLKQVVALTNGASASQIEQANLQLEQEYPSSAGNAADGASYDAAPEHQLDLAEVTGQPQARWGLEIAAAGGHHLLMLGPPGSGKTLLAQRLSSIMPPLTSAHALEVAALASLAGQLPQQVRWSTAPPFQQPHHTATTAAMVGGGSGVIRPGAISLAHRGVLFLDEAPQFRTAALQALREPLESGQVSVARANGCVAFPAKFLLVMAANPCPCGYGFGKGAQCVCSPHRRRAYWAKLSGPLVDRVDLRLLVQAPQQVWLRKGRQEESSATVLQRVCSARERSSWRLREYPWDTNAQVPGPLLRERWPATDRGVRLLEDQVLRGILTMRGADRVLRVAWTLADLAQLEQPDSDQIAAALALRGSEVMSGCG